MSRRQTFVALFVALTIMVPAGTARADFRIHFHKLFRLFSDDSDKDAKDQASTPDDEAAAKDKKSRASANPQPVAKGGDGASNKAGKPKEAVPVATAQRQTSCEQAGVVVGGYGFADVKPASCAGPVYTFNALRSGKAYAIKVDALSGELTEVKKLP